MPRIDKAPEGGKVKAIADATLDGSAGAWGNTDLLCVNFDSAGEIITASTAADAKGVVFTPEGKKDNSLSTYDEMVGGKAYTVIFQGELVEMENSTSPALTAGDVVWAAANGGVATASTTGSVFIGVMVSDSRLWINVNGAPAG